METKLKLNYKKILEILSDKSLVHNHNFEESIPNFSSKSCMYFGIDITSNYIHIGHLMLILFCKILYSVSELNLIVVIGTFTSQIGDPSFRMFARDPKYKSKLNDNCRQLSKIISNICTNIGINFEIKYNHEWLNNICLSDFMNILGKFNTKDLIGSKVFQNIGTKNLSINQFMYPIVQGIDFYHLFKNKHCYIQIGGHDQWINMIYGYDLIKKIENRCSYLITMPLITDRNGNKIGKSENNSSIFLNSDTKVLELINMLLNMDECIFTQIYDRLHIINQHLSEDKIHILNMLVQYIYSIYCETTVDIISSLFNKEYELSKKYLDKFSNDKLAFYVDFHDFVSVKLIVRKIYKNSTSKTIERSIKNKNLYVNGIVVDMLCDIPKFLNKQQVNYIYNKNNFYFFKYCSYE